jgi:hypothetical protein
MCTSWVGVDRGPLDRSFVSVLEHSAGTLQKRPCTSKRRAQISPSTSSTSAPRHLRLVCRRSRPPPTRWCRDREVERRRCCCRGDGGGGIVVAREAAQLRRWRRAGGQMVLHRPYTVPPLSMYYRFEEFCIHYVLGLRIWCLILEFMRWLDRTEDSKSTSFFLMEFMWLFRGLV